MTKKIKELREFVKQLRAEMNQGTGDKLNELVEALISSVMQELDRIKSLKNKS